jgi:CheY-like chemotaxis protein
MSWKPVILCVDDTPSVLEDQRMLLEKNGYRVLTATNGTKAVQAFMSHSVDLVLLDYHMPEDVGEAAMRMKDVKPDVPIALVSGDDCLSGREFDAVDCIMPKSQPIISLLEEIDYLLSIRFLFRPFGAWKAQNTETA